MRLEQLTLDTLTAEQRELYDVMARARSDGSAPARIADDRGVVQGPFTAMLHYPALGAPLQEVGAFLRFHGLLPARARELVILVSAAAERSEFEWWAHVRIGKQAGLTDAEIDAVRNGASLTLEDAVEQAALDAARAVTTGGHDLDDDEYERVHAALGDQMLIETLTLVGYYASHALQMRVLRVPLPDGAQPAFDT
jgi:4-carboxymuconolactone decarboxylase